MAPLDDTTPATRFDSFDIYHTSYKKIGNHEIRAGILVPKTLSPGKHPILVKFHGGGLVTGDCLYRDWIAAFFIPFLHRTGAITILPNYRLIPEHTGADIVDDLTDFWAWFNGGGLHSFLSSQNVAFQLDYDRVLVSGDSAGGYMALMSGLMQPKGTIKAILAQYPMTYYLRRDPTNTSDAQPSPSPTIVDDHISTITPGTVFSSAMPPVRMPLSEALSVQGRYLEFFGDNKKLWPLYLVEEKKYLPPTWIVHGDADTAVSIEDSKAFAVKCKNLEGVEVRLEVRSGQDHGFDIALKEDEEEWLKEGLTWVEEKWLD
ncbi:alpha/beta-hydrolase [Cucurbitaria berberidis CBS 394.84]|uniref:Alpha/beta-hydrolase n=1 Tax=Cucurbitaria berberidis CBS 394.84 TaxID=1168544 RepID=A0A9P4G7Q0_9PLEO|nr:alpha/beta-hydrolase [Cucurbitaria berberidis CBS 394.84]KAF1840250.1 alpha/beta-hydrolase [Cucurbitaria berberidis CBS 394.84]